MVVVFELGRNVGNGLLSGRSGQLFAPSYTRTVRDGTLFVKCLTASARFNFSLTYLQPRRKYPGPFLKGFCITPGFLRRTRPLTSSLHKSSGRLSNKWCGWTRERVALASPGQKKRAFEVFFLAKFEAARTTCSHLPSSTVHHSTSSVTCPLFVFELRRPHWVTRRCIALSRCHSHHYIKLLCARFCLLHRASVFSNPAMLSTNTYTVIDSSITYWDMNVPLGGTCSG